MLEELEGWRGLAGRGRAARRSSPRSSGCRFAWPRPAEPGRVAVLDLLRARTRRFDTVFVVGLEEGSFPRRSEPSPFLGRGRPPRPRRARRAPGSCGPTRSRASGTSSTPPARARRSGSTSSARRRRTTGAPRLASPFWDEARAAFDPAEVARWTRRRPLSALDVADRGRADRAGAPAGARRPRRARRERGERPRRRERLGTATAAGPLRLPRRSTTLTNPAVLAELGGRASFNVTELEAFASCSSIWFVERVRLAAFDRRRGRRQAARVDRPYRAASVLRGASQGGRAPSGSRPQRVEDAVRFLRRCFEDALDGSPPGADRPRAPGARGPAVARPGAVRPGRGRAPSSTLVPRRFEVCVRHRALGARAPARARSGRLLALGEDRPDRRRPVQRAGDRLGLQVRARPRTRRRRSTRSFGFRSRSTCSCCATWSASSRSAGSTARSPGSGDARGLLRAAARDDGVAGFQRNDYRDEEDFWAQIDRASEHAQRLRRADPRRRRRGTIRWATPAAPRGATSRRCAG